jgi:rhamnose transport system permease protein
MRKLISIREFPIFVVFVLFYLTAGLGNHQIFTTSGLHDILFGSAIVALLAVAETLIIVMKHIDLSIGSVIGFSSYLIGKNASEGHGLFFCMSIGVGLGLLVGALNGLLVAYFRLPSLVVTLGTLYLVRGYFSQVVGGDFINSGQVPKLLTSMATHTFVKVPLLFIVSLIVALIVGLYMRNMRSGRDLYAIGSNHSAALLAGINVAHRTFWAFTAAGGITGFAGAVLLARYGQAQANSGLGIELNVVAACVVGGVAIAGGVGTVYGAIIGAILLQTIVLALGALGVSQFWQGVVNGALLIAAISLDKILSMRSVRTQIMRKVQND